MSSLREDQVEAAVRFLSNEKVKDRSLEEKQDFLRKKGVTDAEIDEAIRRNSTGGSSSAPPAAQPTPPVSPVPPMSQQPQQSYPPPPPTMAYGQGYAPQMQAPAYGYAPPGGMAGMPPQSMQMPMYQPMPAYEIPPQFEQAQTSGSRWAWGLGGVAAGLGLTSLLAHSFTQRTQQKLIEGNAALLQQQQFMYPQAASHGAFPLAAPTLPPLETTASKNPPAVGGVAVQDDAIKPVVKDIEKEKDKDTEKDAKEVYEDLLALLRQNSEEAKETSAMFKKAITQQQEQYQQVFTKMQDFLTTQSQQQKPQKSTPTDLSAATLQALASLIEGAKSGAPMERADGTSIGNTTVATSSGPPNSLRESFDAITHNLNRLIHESSSKTDASKALNTLSLILQNLLKNNGQDKDRKVNTSSARFAPLAKGAQAELLKLAGFEFRDPMFTLPSDQSLEAAEHVRDLLVSKQRTLDQDWVDRPAVEAGTEAAVANSQTEQRRSDEHGDTTQAVSNPVAASSSTSSHVEPQRQNDMFPATGNAPQVPTDGNEGARRVARPWESSVPKATIPPRPWETTQAPPVSAVVEQNGGDDEEDHRFTQPRVQQFTPGAANVTMAHPAESPETGVGPSIAHPAESEDVPQQQPQQAPMQPQPTVPTVVQPPEVPAVSHRTEAPTIAHPAERSAVSEEPQSGG